MPPEIGRLVLVIGIVLVVIGGLSVLGVRLPIGRLPGDISIVRPGFRLYVPITSAVLVSVVASGVIALVRYLMR